MTIVIFVYEGAENFDHRSIPHIPFIGALSIVALRHFPESKITSWTWNRSGRLSFSIH